MKFKMLILEQVKIKYIVLIWPKSFHTFKNIFTIIPSRLRPSTFLNC